MPELASDGGGKARLTARQRTALALLRDCAGYDEGWGVVTATETHCSGGQPWINWRTVAALERRGYVEVEDWFEPEGGRVRLKEADRVA